MKVRVGIGKKEDLEFSYFVYKSYVTWRSVCMAFKKSGAPSMVSHAFNSRYLRKVDR